MSGIDSYQVDVGFDVQTDTIELSQRVESILRRLSPLRRQDASDAIFYCRNYVRSVLRSASPNSAFCNYVIFKNVKISFIATTTITIVNVELYYIDTIDISLNGGIFVFRSPVTNKIYSFDLTPSGPMNYSLIHPADEIIEKADAEYMPRIYRHSGDTNMRINALANNECDATVMHEHEVEATDVLITLDDLQTQFASYETRRAQAPCGVQVSPGIDFVARPELTLNLGHAKLDAASHTATTGHTATVYGKAGADFVARPELMLNLGHATPDAASHTTTTGNAVTVYDMQIAPGWLTVGASATRRVVSAAKYNIVKGFDNFVGAAAGGEYVDWLHDSVVYAEQSTTSGEDNQDIVLLYDAKNFNIGTGIPGREMYTN